jgi:hypothetical protein
LRIKAYASAGLVRIRDLRGSESPLAGIAKPGRFVTLSPEKAAKLYGISPQEGVITPARE